MPQFRKKPVVIEAEQYRADASIVTQYPGDPRASICFDDHWKNDPDADGPVVTPHIHTLEGVHQVKDGDWIIRGVKGEFYPVKPDIFEQTYERVKEKGDVTVSMREGISPDHSILRMSIEVTETEIQSVRDPAVLIDAKIRDLREQLLGAVRGVRA